MQGNSGNVLDEKRKGDGGSNSDGDREGEMNWGDGDMHEGDNERGDRADRDVGGRGETTRYRRG